MSEHMPFLEQESVDTLSTLLQRHTGKVAAKWQAYFQHYDKQFKAFKQQPIRLLEIGVQAGGSLEIWAQYFKHATLIVGCDIDPACGHLSYEDPRIKILIGDINKKGTVKSLHKLTKTLDIVIDDGSHNTKDVIISFVQLFPHLTDGGTYLIEDLHCSYWESYGGGLFDKTSAISFFKKIVDVVNKPVWGVQIEPKVFFGEFHTILSDTKTHNDWSFLANIHSIEFVNSMCIIKKRDPQKNSLGPLVLSGEVAAGSSSNYNYASKEMSVPDQSYNILSQQTSDQNENSHRLALAKEKITYLTQDNLKLTTQVYESTKSFYESQVKIQELEFKLKQLEQSNNMFSVLKQENLKLTTQVYESTKNFYESQVKVQQLEFKLKQLDQLSSKKG
jgi:hypothetical protein